MAQLTNPSVDAAARAIDVAPTTLMRWMKDFEFDSAYRVARRAAFGQSVAVATGDRRRRFGPAESDGGLGDAAIGESPGSRQRSRSFGEGNRTGGY